MDAAGVEPAVPGAADLQSTGVTNFPTHPKTTGYLLSLDNQSLAIRFAESILKLESVTGLEPA